MTQDGREEGPTPLEYRSPPAPKKGMVREAISGFIGGAFLFGFYSGMLAEYQRVPPVGTTRPSRAVVWAHTWPALFCALIVVATACGFIVLRRVRPHAMTGLGVLLGVGVMALCEGLCFAFH